MNWSKLQLINHRILALLIIAVAGCSQRVAQLPEAPSAPSPAASPSPVAIPTPTPTASPDPKQQVYREKSGLFAISLPKGYTHKATASGVAFVSSDQGFAGAVDYGSAEGKQLNTQQLEASLKAAFTERLKQVNWQTSQVQPDGSLRLDWTGKDKNGDALDAVSIVEQRGNYIFVLNLFGINKPYQNYNSDAETIVNSYQIQPSSAQANQAQPNQIQPSPSGNSSSNSIKQSQQKSQK
jgi:hypothetical protein